MNREMIFSRKLPSEMIVMPEWDGNVVVRRLTASEYLALVNRINALIRPG